VAPQPLFKTGDPGEDRQKNVSRLRSVQQEKEQIVAAASDAEVFCRGFEHDWPKSKTRFKKGGVLPKGWTTRILHDGILEIRQACNNDCGKVRWFETLPHGIWGEETGRWQYGEVSGSDWHVISLDAGNEEARPTKRDWRQEFFRRSQPAIKASATAS
jgi:hypothetical protein